MAVVPATKTFTDGIATSSEANAYIRDVLNFLLARPIAQARQATLQSITSATYTSILFDAEDVDTNVAGTGQHDLVTNNSRFTAVYPGWYQASGATGWATNVTGRRGGHWAVNGVTMPGGAALMAAGTGGTSEMPVRTMLFYLNVGDYIELQGFQDSGGALNTATGSDQQTTMTIIWVSN